MWKDKKKDKDKDASTGKDASGVSSPSERSSFDSQLSTDSFILSSSSSPSSSPSLIPAALSSALKDEAFTASNLSLHLQDPAERRPSESSTASAEKKPFVAQLIPRKSLFFKLFPSSSKEAKSTKLEDVIRQLEEAENSATEELDLLSFLSEDPPVAPQAPPPSQPQQSQPAPKDQPRKKDASESLEAFSWLRRAGKSKKKDPAAAAVTSTASTTTTTTTSSVTAPTPAPTAASPPSAAPSLPLAATATTPSLVSESTQGKQESPPPPAAVVPKDHLDLTPTPAEQPASLKIPSSPLAVPVSTDLQLAPVKGETESLTAALPAPAQAEILAPTTPQEGTAPQVPEKPKSPEKQKTAREIVLEQRAAIAEKRARFLKLLKEQAEKKIKTQDFAYSPQDPRHWGEREPLRFSKPAEAPVAALSGSSATSQQEESKQL